MPSVSAKQKNFFRGCKHNPESMDAKCPPKKVVDEFVSADSRKQTKNKKKHRRKQNRERGS